MIFLSILRIIVKVLGISQNGRGYFDLINLIIRVFFNSHIFILNIILKMILISMYLECKYFLQSLYS